VRKTLKDVAELAGVSSAAASLALNGHNDRVSPDVARRVQAAAKRLNYQPNLVARSLRTQETKTIGFISDNVATTPFAGQMIAGAQEVAWRNNWLLLMIDTEKNSDLELAAIKSLSQRNVDGFIYASMYHRAIKVPSQLESRPVVLLDCVEDSKKSIFNSVIPNEYEGALAAIRHLIAAGHRHIGHITTSEGGIAVFERLRAYKDALAEADIEFNPNYVWQGPDSNAPEGYEGAKKLLSGKSKITAIFCYTDRIAMGLYEYAHEKRISIPQDLSVVGFDNQLYLASALRPGLTTVQLPHYAMGAWATQRMIEMLSTEDSDSLQPMRELSACPLVERESVAPPRSK
jgi:LacI family transcriptional regulator